MENTGPDYAPKIDAIMRDIPARCRSTQDSLDFAQDILRLIEQEAQKEQKSTESSVVSPSILRRITQNEPNKSHKQEANNNRYMNSYRQRKKSCHPLWVSSSPT